MGRITDRLKKIRIRWVILVVLLIVIGIIRMNPAMGEWYARTVYPLLSGVLSRVSSFFPFSVGDCFIYGSIAGLLVYLVYAIVKRRSWKRTTGRIVEYLLWVYIWFYFGWGLNYFREDFFTRTGIPYVEYSPDKFRSFLTAYTDSLNASWVAFEKVDTSLVSREVKNGYQKIAGLFGMNQPADYLRVKPMLLSPLMSGVGVLGYMGPFFTEYNLNRDLLPVQYPFTYAHEMAHVLGITNEAEANLYGYLICTRSQVPEIRFAGYFGLFSYVLGNAYSLLSEEEFKQWTSTIRPEIKELYNRKLAYWEARYNPLIAKMQNVAYDIFLKGNNIPSGRKNYSEVIGLLIAWLEKK